MKRLLLLPLLLSSLHAGTIPGIEFAKVDGLSLKLDLHRPDREKPPLVVYLHGGAWRAVILPLSSASHRTRYSPRRQARWFRIFDEARLQAVADFLQRK